MESGEKGGGERGGEGRQGEGLGPHNILA